jgi:rubrerythrin
MKPPEPAIGSLIEQSEDLHSDAMRDTRSHMNDLVEHGRDLQEHRDPDADAAFQGLRRNLFAKRLGAGGALAGVGLMPGLISWLTSAAGSASMEVQAAQTAAALENLAVAVYKQAAALPFMAKIPDPAGKTVTAFVTKTIEQHTDHAGAFNAAAKKLGGKAQTDVDQVVMDKVVKPALPTLTDPLKVVKFAADLELVAAETYAVETAAVDDANLRKVFSSIMGVENQHRAVLLAVAALLENDLADQVKIPPDLAKLPAAAGSVAFPQAFLPTDQARPASEGAVK